MAVKKGATLEYVHQDHLTGTALTTDNAGALKSSLEYFPFGMTRSSTGTLGTDRKFTGQRLDGTGLYFYNARSYDAGLGRFTSADTIVPDPANPQAFNRYAYVLNNPLKYVDPTGHCFIACPALVLATPWGQALVVAVAGVMVQWWWMENDIGGEIEEVFDDFLSGQAAQPDPWNRGPEQERSVRTIQAQEYEQSYGTSDTEIARNLGIRGRVADSVGRHRETGRWLVAESKGSNIKVGVDQLENTVRALTRQGISRGLIDTRMYVNDQTWMRLISGEGLGGRFIRDGFLAYWERGRWIYELVDGERILVLLAP